MYVPDYTGIGGTGRTSQSALTCVASRCVAPQWPSNGKASAGKALAANGLSNRVNLGW